MADEDKKYTPLRGASSNIHLIRVVLYSYTNELRCSSPPSPQRDELLKTIETMCERIGAVKITRERETSHEFGFSPDELTLVDRALTAYIVSIGQSVPPSEERDEVMRGCEALKVQIMADRMLPSP